MSGLRSKMVGVAGLEPARVRPHRRPRPERLPVSPHADWLFVCPLGTGILGSRPSAQPKGNPARRLARFKASGAVVQAAASWFSFLFGFSGRSPHKFCRLRPEVFPKQKARSTLGGIAVRENCGLRFRSPLRFVSYVELNHRAAVNTMRRKKNIQKPTRSPGPQAERLRIEGDWKSAVKKAIHKPKPAEGWPKDGD